MMKTESIYKHILEPSGNGREYRICPRCGAKKFTCYIDVDTGLPLADYVGRCERINSCGYHYPPREYFKSLNFQNGKNMNNEKEQSVKNEKHQKLDRALDEIRKKYGEDAVQKGTLLK